MPNCIILRDTVWYGCTSLPGCKSCFIKINTTDVHKISLKKETRANGNCGHGFLAEMTAVSPLWALVSGQTARFQGDLVMLVWTLCTGSVSNFGSLLWQLHLLCSRAAQNLSHKFSMQTIANGELGEREDWVISALLNVCNCTECKHTAWI